MFLSNEIPFLALFYILSVFILFVVAIITQLIFRKNEFLSVEFRYVFSIFIVWLLNKYWLKSKVYIGFNNVPQSYQLSSYLLIFILFITYYYNFRFNDLNQPLTDAICFSVGPGIFEEYIFRGIILKAFLNYFKTIAYKNIFISILIASLLFGSTHALNILVIGQPIITTIIQIIDAFTFGMLLSAIYLRTKNIILPILIHIFVDFSCNILDSIVNVNNTAHIIQDILFIIVSLILIRSSMMNKIISYKNYDINNYY